MSNLKPLTLSASSLSLFNECPRCFWLRFVKGIYRPDTIFPSLPGGMDSVIKIYFDKYRKVGLPPELEGKIQGKLFPDQMQMDRWRARSGGLWYEDKKLGARLMGLIDDLLVHGKLHLPLDYKTRGSAPREDTSRYYQHQLDIYGFLLDKNERPSGSTGYLVYWWPEEVREEGIVRFAVEPKAMEVDPERAYDLFRRAVTTIRGDEPAPGPRCGFCVWAGREEITPGAFKKQKSAPAKRAKTKKSSRRTGKSQASLGL